MYDAVADLPLTVEAWELERRERETSAGFSRVTTEVVLRGGDREGRGEDVAYETADHDAFRAGFDADLAGEYTVASFSAALDDVDLWPDPPSREDFRRYRRWAFEAAALDLALEQADADLGSALGREYDPVRFVVSTRLPEADGAPTTDRVDAWRDVDPDLEFKLDPTPAWDEGLIADLAATDAVRVVDLKGLYEGTEVDAPADPEFYRRVVEGVPGAVVEDPKLTEATRPVFEGREERVSWDYPITGVESVESLPFEPAWLNCKPSRFGTLESLFEFLEHCEERGIALYGGGQFELGVGRGQLHDLASLCYPDGPNDVAPRGYNDPEPRAGLPSSPLAVPDERRGFGWR